MPEPPTDEIARAMVASAAAAVLDTEAAALQDEPDGVHQHRTRVRRLRSVLAGLHRAVAYPGAQRVRVAFAPWGMQLGVVRDIEVSADVAAAALAAAGIEDARARRRLVDDERASYLTAHARLVALAAEPPARERMRMLRELAGHPSADPSADPSAGTGEPDAADAMIRLLRHEGRRVHRARAHLDDSLGGYHALRKAGRRLRYVAEAVDEAMPTALGGDLARAGEGVHDVLGDHRDALLFAARLELVRAQAGRAGEPTLLYDRLIDDAHRAAADLLEELPGVLDALDAATVALEEH